MCRCSRLGVLKQFSNFPVSSSICISLRKLYDRCYTSICVTVYSFQCSMKVLIYIRLCLGVDIMCGLGDALDKEQKRVA